MDYTFSPKLSEAFKAREGHTDEQSFMTVVGAFFEDLEKNELLLVPKYLPTDKEGGVMHNGSLLPYGENETVLVVLSDLSYLEQYEVKAYYGIEARKIVRMLKEDSHITGIIINLESPSRCFLPREAVIGFLDSIGYNW